MGQLAVNAPAILQERNFHVQNQRSFVNANSENSAESHASDSIFPQMTGLVQERVFRLALRITRNAEDAEDVQQETFLKVHRKAAQFEGRARFTTWISRIAINEALMCLRRRRGNIYVPLDDATPVIEAHLPMQGLRAVLEDPEEAYARKELKDSLAHAIAILRPAYRSVFLLRVVGQLSTTETARILRISASAVKARMRRARGELQAMLQTC
jgi:RNA polymerase sigma-70 factor (ECF subfamily)